MPNIKTTVYLDENDYAALQAIAAGRGSSTAELIRTAIHRFVQDAAGQSSATRVAETSPRYRHDALDPERGPTAPLPSVADRLADLQALLRERPRRDHRSADEILGYDERGLPT